MTDYCTASDVYQHGLPRGAAVCSGRLVATVSVTSSTLELDDHGLAAGDAVTLRAEAGGSLPAPLASGVLYYALPVDERHFRIAATQGGTAITLSTAGSRIVLVPPSPLPAAISWASRIIDDMLPAHVVPLSSPFPAIVVMTCAELAAGKQLALTGTASKTIGELVDAARARLTRWGKGVPIRGEHAPRPANLSVSATAAPVDARGWRTYGGIS